MLVVLEAGAKVNEKHKSKCNPYTNKISSVYFQVNKDMNLEAKDGNFAFVLQIIIVEVKIAFTLLTETIGTPTRITNL